MNLPLVSIVIVNYNAGRLLRQCLESVREQTYPNWEVIIVDNASHDESLTTVEDLPGITVLCNKENRGFAAGQNQGIAVSSGGYVLALNFDVILPSSFLGHIVSAMEQHPTAGWGCGKLLQMSPQGVVSDRLYAAGHYMSMNRFAALRGYGELDIGTYDAEEYVFGAPGAVALYRREFISSVALDGQFFDEHLFTWYEDVDVDWRGQNRGWKCLYAPAAVAYHAGHVGEEYPEPFRSFRAAMAIRNRWLVMASNETWGSFLKAVPGILPYELSLVLYVVRVGLVGSYMQALREFLISLAYVKRKRTQVHRKTYP